MKIHIVTVGEPKLAYARAGWEEYCKRLGRFHQLRRSHLSDKSANDASAFRDAIGKAFCVALVVGAKQLTSQQLADTLEHRAQDGREVCFVIGGPDGLPSAIITNADQQWGLSELTFPHDLAMVIVAEALYRASSINAGLPYHRA